MPLYFLKLGGSAITDKTAESTPRLNVIRDAARAVRQAREKSPDLKLLLGHGSGSFGHFAARRWGFGSTDKSKSPADLWRAYAETGAAAQRLNRLVTDIFLNEGVPVVSLQPSSTVRMFDGQVVALSTENILSVLKHDLIPLVYGDVAFDDRRGMAIASTDALFAYLAPMLKPARIIYATAVNGVYTSDPLIDANAQLVSEITPQSFAQIRAGVGSAHGVDVTGGMLDKLARSVALVASQPSLEILVTSAEPLTIKNLLSNPELRTGTWIHA